MHHLAHLERVDAATLERGTTPTFFRNKHLGNAGGSQGSPHLLVDAQRICTSFVEARPSPGVQLFLLLKLSTNDHYGAERIRGDVPVVCHSSCRSSSQSCPWSPRSGARMVQASCNDRRQRSQEHVTPARPKSQSALVISHARAVVAEGWFVSLRLCTPAAGRLHFGNQSKATMTPPYNNGSHFYKMTLRVS
jgi:hypothetical protein